MGQTRGMQQLRSGTGTEGHRAGRRGKTILVGAIGFLAAAALASQAGNEPITGAQGPALRTHAALTSATVKDAMPLRGAPENSGEPDEGTPVRSLGALVRANSGTQQLIYGGGSVVTGKPKVYLIFWGNQWGKATTNSAGQTVLAGDKSSVAPDLQSFFSGLGSNGESWSGVMTQYCQGAVNGAITCPSTTGTHISLPATTGVVSGVWVDESAAAPNEASQGQLANEAVAGATHFGNTSVASNVSAQYVVISPSGTHPGGFNAGADFCAWHSATQDSGLTGAPGGAAIYYTNLPYIPDMGWSCGADYVNGITGALDGVTIVEGHEYAETLTDPEPGGGWVDSTGYEIGDKCAWVGTGGTGGAVNLNLSTGSYAVQAMWSNATGACANSSSVFNAADKVTLTPPAALTAINHGTVSTKASATSSVGSAVTYSASGLPAGLTLNSTSGVITGAPTTNGTTAVTLSARDASGASASASWSVTVKSDTVTLATPAAASGKVGAAFSDHLTATSSSSLALTYAATPLPAGVALSSTTGVLSGTPTTAGSTTVRVTVTDTSGATASTSFVITVAPKNVITITGSSTLTGAVGTPVHVTLAATDSGKVPVSFSGVSLPKGVTISSAGVISGTPTVSGTSHATITAADATGVTATLSVTFTVVPAQSAK